MSNHLSKSFSFLSLMRFTAPTIVMMIFMSLYTMVDGAFVSRFVGTSALSAVNIVYPVLSVVVAVGIMLATGGSAVIARKMGEDKPRAAKEDFTFIVITGIAIGAALAAVGFIFMHPILKMLGATEGIYAYCRDYMFVLLFFTPCSILQMLFQFFFVTVGKPHTGLAVTVTGGFANIILDYIFIVPLDMGVAGAALATGIGFSIPAVFGMVYFTFKRRGTLYFVKPRFDGAMLAETCLNGSSEMVTNLSMAVTTFMFNIAMIRLLGEDGVAAITIVLYAQYFLTAVYLGYSSGVAPIISYNYGSGNEHELKKLFKISMIFLLASSVAMFAAALLLGNGIVTIFAPAGSAVYQIARNGFALFAVSYLFIGANIFASSLFTALSNGKVSAIISFLRTFVFLIAAILLLPLALGVNGLWLAVPMAEFLTLIISALFVVKLRGFYRYA